MSVYTVIITNKAFDEKWLKQLYPTEALMKPLLDNPNELLYTDQLDRHYGDMPHRVVLMMLDNLNKPFAELKTPIEEWAYIFKNETLKSEIIPETKVIEGIEFLANKNLGIREFIERMDVNNLPRDVSNSYM